MKTQKEYDEQFEDVAKDLARIFHIKNTEYGAAYFQEENAGNWFFELKRKYIRLDQINKNGDKETEAKRENLNDMAIYAIMELIRMG